MDSIVLPDEIISKILTYNTHPAADIIKHHFKDDVPWVSKFVFMRYHGFIPLTDCGSNGRKIHNDYGEYWEDYEKEDDEDEEEEAPGFLLKAIPRSLKYRWAPSDSSNS